MRKHRIAHGWSLREFAARSGINLGTLSQIENGKRPMTESQAIKCDELFPELKGWFLEFYEESKSWMPAGFRDWSECENRARDLLVWTPGAIDGVAQTSDYARELLSIYPGVTADIVDTRLANRMERQKRLFREDGPTIGLLVDMAALYRGVGSAEIMAAQCRRLLELATMPQVTMQVVPPVKINLATALVILADDAAYTENAIGGAVFTDTETVARLRALITTVRAEARPASESLAIVRKADTSWTGASRHTQATAARRASKRPPAKDRS